MNAIGPISRCATSRRGSGVFPRTAVLVGAKPFNANEIEERLRSSTACSVLGSSSELNQSDEHRCQASRDSKNCLDSIVEFSAMYASRSFLCSADPFLHVPLERKPDILLSYQAQRHRCLQLTHPEQKAVISVRDESLCVRCASALPVAGTLRWPREHLVGGCAPSCPARPRSRGPPPSRASSSPANPHRSSDR